MVAATQNGLRTRSPAGQSSPFLLGWKDGRLTSLRFRNDSFPTEYIQPGFLLGEIETVWRRQGAGWQSFRSAHAATGVAQVLSVPHQGTGARYAVSDDAGLALAIRVLLATRGEALRWSVHIRNVGSSPVEIGDLALPLPMHTLFKGGQPPASSVLKHSFISGAGSFLFWMRSNSVGPWLLMLPEPGTSLEFWERVASSKDLPSVYTAYLHSMARGEAVARLGGRWRQPHTSLLLGPGEERTYAFSLYAATDYNDVRRRIAAAGLLDVEVAPGMTVPSDLSTTIALRSANPVASLTAEHPDRTTIWPLGRRGEYQLYRIRFARLGENMLTVRQRDGRSTFLEFFATEPLETLIRKRGAFIASHQQRAPDKWYRGLLSEWNMESGVMLGPDNYDRIKGWRRYEVTCDDPGLSKPAFLASKLAEFPVQAEVDAIDEYIEHFVWGGLQRTTQEKYSYGIYGIIDWKQNRTSAKAGPEGQLHMWRPYDYPHLVVMYWGMYRMARDFPGMHTRLTRDQYLERACGTALALFTVPKQLIDWEAYETGFYNEFVIPSIVEELERLGQEENAARLRTEWEKKVRFFVTGGPDLFGSEYAFDSTGFESTQALARYAIDRTASGTLQLPAPDSTQRDGAPAFAPVTAMQAKVFAETQMRANLFCRGMVEKAYYIYGSDLRAEGSDAYLLSYMAQMGGWAVLDHALHDRLVPDATVRLGYASYLSAWALLNTGNAESNYGYWFPGKDNDGGAGGGFEPAAISQTWLGMPNRRGSWFYSCEEDLGFCAALRTARTVLEEDQVFGTFCFGGEMTEEAGVYRVQPRDGLRRRLSCRLHGQSLDLELFGVRIAAAQPLVWSPAERLLRLPLEWDQAATGGDARLILHGPLHFHVQAANNVSQGSGGKPLSLSFAGSASELMIRYSGAAEEVATVPSPSLATSLPALYPPAPS